MSIIDQFIGLDTEYPLANGGQRRRIHLDGAASPLVMQTAETARQSLLAHYSNSHSGAHASAHISGEAFHWANKTILDICGANSQYALATLGNGATAVLNNIARRLKKRQQERPIVLVSAMEHHANDLPHREQGYTVMYMPLCGDSAQLGEIDLDALATLFAEHGAKINYVTFSGVSNVTGIRNPVAEISQLAHQYNAYSILDAAQMTAHMALDISHNDIDFVAFSGHKVYCAGSPGILIAKQALLQQYPSDEVGGGVVKHVSYHDVEYTEQYPTREQAGTKNVLGTYALAKVMLKLDQYGMQNVQQHGEMLWAYAYQQLSSITGISLYGKSNVALNNQRIGALSFNILGIDHGLAARVLSDYFAIAVRNECFCAHPYVSAMLKQELWDLDLETIAEAEQEAFINRKRGMLRASFSVYNTQQDIDMLCAAIRELQNKITLFSTQYLSQEDGSYRHKSFRLSWQDFVD